MCPVSIHREVAVHMQAARATTSSAARILPTNPTDGSLPAPNGSVPMNEDDDMNLAGTAVKGPATTSYNKEKYARS